MAETALWRLRDESDTAALAGALWRALAGQAAAIAAAGLNLCLEGELGTGKTALTRALLRASGHQGQVKSPTFELLVTYDLPGGLLLRHFDCYRLARPEEFREAGFDELFGAGVVTVCEWPERAGPFLPPADLSVTLSHGAGATEREARLTARGPLGAALLAALGQPS